MHGDDKIGFQHADNFRGFRGVEAVAAAHWDKSHVDRAQQFDLALGGYLLQVAKMRNGDAVIIKDINRVANLVLRFFAIVSLNRRNEYAANFKLAGTSDHMCGAFDRVTVVVTGRIVTDSNDLSF